MITRIVPGGPLEQMMMQSQAMGQDGSMAAGAERGSQALSDEQLAYLKEFYGLDKPWVEAYLIWLGKVVRGDLGTSTRYQDPVWEMISERFPISLYFGLVTLFVTYGTCIPLGVIKAIKHRTWIDNATSILVFVGYAIPNYVIGAILLFIFSAHLGWFPMGNFVSENFAELSLLGKAQDLLSHTILPLAAYLMGSFAFVTFLMKNHLLENLAADYIRTAVAKGVSFRKAVREHALRNSLIPIATNFGQNIVLLVGGSFLIETIFDINGFGLLGFTAILDRDYPVVMGVLLIGSLLLLIGNILSDMLVALVDPRIRFK